MIMIEIYVTATASRAVGEATAPITEGMAGVPIAVSFNDAWAGLTKKAYARCGENVKTVILDADGVGELPYEILEANKKLEIGVEGWDASGAIRIPTEWAFVARVKHSAAGCCKPEPAPTPGVIDQLITIAQGADEKANTAQQRAAEAETAAQEAVDAAREAVDAANRIEESFPPVLSAAQGAAQRAETAAISSEASANKSELWAQMARQGAAEKGFMYVEGEDDGHLYLYTENTEGITLEDNNGSPL